jgi:hypothetical protein
VLREIFFRRKEQEHNARALLEEVMKGRNMLSDKAALIQANAVATAIESSRKFNKAEFDTAARLMTDAAMKDPTLVPELGEMLGPITNTSACAKDLARAGLVSEGDASAFARRVGDALDKRAEAKSKAEKAITGAK